MEKKKSVFMGVKRLKGFSNTEKQCNKCGFVTFYLRVLYTHKYKCQGKLLGSLTCCYCKRRFNFLSSFSQHQKTCVKRYLKKKTMLKRKLNKKAKILRQKNIKKSIASKKSCAVACPTCLNLFPSKHSYSVHMRRGPCAPKSPVEKQHFSARKSLPNAHDNRHKISKKMKDSEAWQSMDDSYSNDGPLKPQNEKTSGSDSTLNTDDGYMCLWCKSMYPSKGILFKHLERNSRCAKAHYRLNSRNSSPKMSFTARKSMQPVVARKSFPRSNNRTPESLVFKDVVGSARKSLPNSAQKKFRKRASPSPQSPVKSLNICPVCYVKFPNNFSFFKHQKKLGHWGKATKTINSSCKCPFCSKEFLHIRARNDHLRNHADKYAEDIKYFLKCTTCNICYQIFASAMAKQQHVKLFHSKSSKVSHNAKASKEFIRSYSSKQDPSSNKHSLLPFVIKQKLKEHPNSCPVCSKDFSTTSFRNKHFQEKHLDSELECKFCPLKFNNVDRLEFHMQDSHYDDFKFKCLSCKINLATAPHVVLHVTKVHPDDDPKNIVRCRVTEPTSSNQQKIAERLTLNTQVPKERTEHYCDICNLNFMKLCGLSSHRQSKSHRDTLVKSLDAMHRSLSNLPPSPPPPQKKHIPQPEILVCSECSDEFTSIKDFVPHRLSHFSFQSKYMKINELNSYTCEICGDVSDSHSKVQMHLFWHLQVESTSNEKSSLKGAKNDPIVPDRLSGQHVAKKSFSKSPDSQQEVIIGGVKKPLFTCEACKIGFTTQAHYSLHVRRFCKMKNSTSPKRTAAEEPEEKDAVSPQKTIVAPTTTNNCTSPKSTVVEEPGEKDAVSPQETIVVPTATTENEHQTQNEGDEITHCMTCNSLFRSSVAETHTSFCSKCEQSSVLECDIDILKSTMEVLGTLATCVACNSSFDDPLDFSKHMLTHHASINENTAENSKNIMHCTTCNCLFFSSNVLENHEVVCSNFSYSDFDALSNKDILKAASALDSAIAICISCCLAFSDDQNLNEHISTHKEKTIESDLDLDAKASNGPYNFCEDDQAMPSETEKLHNVEKSPSPLLNSDSSKTDPEYTIDTLRENFSKLLCILIADQDLMHQLGYGERPVDDVLSNVLEQMGQVPTLKDDQISDLDCLRKNIQMFLDFCLKDQIMELIGNGRNSTDDIVIEALKTFSNDDNNVKAVTSE